MPRDAVSRTANVGTVGTNGLRVLGAPSNGPHDVERRQSLGGGRTVDSKNVQKFIHSGKFQKFPDGLAHINIAHQFLKYLFQ